MRSLARNVRRDENGVVLPVRLVIASISAIALGGLVFVATQPEEPADTAKQVTSQPTPTKAATPKASPKPPAPAIQRNKVYVVVFNNSNIKGLAGSTATKAQGLGWNVVGSDNWYGTIDASTVYFPEHLEAAAKVLAKDLRITRLKPAIDPMQPDRLTVILTGPV